MGSSARVEAVADGGLLARGASAARRTRGRGLPVGGQWNYDHDNRDAPPRKETLEPWWPEEDEIDSQVRADLWERSGEASFVGMDGPRRFAVTRREALQVLKQFIARRLPDLGPYEDAKLSGDDWMAHSLLSAFSSSAREPRPPKVGGSEPSLKLTTYGLDDLSRELRDLDLGSRSEPR